MQLVIPTYRRVDKQLTLQNLPPVLQQQTILVASDVEERAALRERYNVRDVVVATGVQSIAEKRHWIVTQLGCEHVFMLDDDLRFGLRCPLAERTWSEEDGSWHTDGQFLLRAQPEQLVPVFDWLAQCLQNGYGAVGIGSRMHNNRNRLSYARNTRLMFAFGLSRTAYNAAGVRFDDVRVREDFHVTLGLLRAGYENVSLLEATCDQDKFNAPGGASSERSMELSNQEAERLAQLHPGLVRVVERAYSASIPRKEVVVSWKKALNYVHNGEE